MGNWKLCPSAVCPTPLDIERGASRELSDGKYEEIYLTKPNTYEWSDPEKWLVTTFILDEDGMDTEREEFKFDTEEEAIYKVFQMCGLDISLDSYRSLEVV